MKNLKKLLSIFAAFFLVLGLSVNIHATPDSNDSGTSANRTGTITIEDAIEGKTYKLYRLFDLESYNREFNAYSYKINDRWTNFFTENGDGLNFVQISSTGYVTWKKDADVKEFAEKAIAYAHAHGIQPVDQKTLTLEIIQPGTDYIPKKKTITFNDLPLGYYLVDSNSGALCNLTTTDPESKINEKNDVPTIKKEVQEGEEWKKGNDAQVGDLVNFKTTVKVTPGTKAYKVHDKMDDGLEFKADSVIVKRNENDSPLTEGYNLVTSSLDDGCTFEITFGDELIQTIQNDTNDSQKTIVITYSAYLTDDAIIKGDGNDNKTHLEYNNGDGTERTPDSITKTFSWEFGVFKYSKQENNNKGLANAEFQIKTSNATTAKGLVLTTLSGTKTPTYKVKQSPEESDEPTTIRTDKDGKFIIQGLDAGTYYLYETKAPDGYNILKEPLTIVITSRDSEDKPGYKEIVQITSNGKAASSEVIENGTIAVENKTGAVLPETGGMGTTLLYVAGGILLIGSAVLLVTKKRMGHEN